MNQIHLVIWVSLMQEMQEIIAAYEQYEDAKAHAEESSLNRSGFVYVKTMEVQTKYL